jgi:dTDP-4-dehydrorhamnose 3,5-epimerase
MDIVALAIPDVKLLKPRRICDARGFFAETFSRRRLAEAGLIADFVQDNHSLSTRRGTVRGLHFQREPFAQAKIVRVVRGAIFDVILDIRPRSPSFGAHVAIELTAESGQQLYIPEGFAHGFCTLAPDTEVAYKISRDYAPDHEGGILWNDPALGIAWPVRPDEATLSERDRRWPSFAAWREAQFNIANAAGMKGR